MCALVTGVQTCALPISPDGALHFLADSNAAITKGIIALVLLTVQDRQPTEILTTDIEDALAPFDLPNQLSSNRTQGIPNMISTEERSVGQECVSTCSSRLSP